MKFYCKKHGHADQVEPCCLKAEFSKPKLKILGRDGNAFAILGAARQVALKNHMEWKAISEEAMAGDYNHLLQTMMKYFDVC
jgi:hypothetical protein